jgi:hypothetical protein
MAPAAQENVVAKVKQSKVFFMGISLGATAPPV